MRRSVDSLAFAHSITSKICQQKSALPNSYYSALDTTRHESLRMDLIKRKDGGVQLNLNNRAGICCGLDGVIYAELWLLFDGCVLV